MEYSFPHTYLLEQPLKSYGNVEIRQSFIKPFVQKGPKA